MVSRHKRAGRAIVLFLLLWSTVAEADRERTYKECIIGCDIQLVQCGIKCFTGAGLGCYVDCIHKGKLPPFLCMEQCGLTVFNCIGACMFPLPFSPPGPEPGPRPKPGPGPAPAPPIPPIPPPFPPKPLPPNPPAPTPTPCKDDPRTRYL